MELNGNEFVTKKTNGACDHVFVMHGGCYFPTKDFAKKFSSENANSTGLYYQSINFDGKEWFKLCASNAWD